MDTAFLFPIHILENFDKVWTFILIFIRFVAMMVFIPGLGGGAMGIRIRIPAIIVMTFVSCSTSATASLPTEWGGIVASMFSELLFGMMLGIIPAMSIAGVQTAMQLSSTTMGLSAGQMYDPSMGSTTTSLGLLCGNLCICFFLLLGGHHYVLYAASGLGGEIVPGSFLVTESGVRLIINRMGAIFEAGALISAPVIVAILLTKFVMGLISRAVPQVNIFIIAFPLTIGIGLIITALSLPEICTYIENDFRKVESEIVVITEDTARAP